MSYEITLARYLYDVGTNTITDSVREQLLCSTDLSAVYRTIMVRVLGVLGTAVESERSVLDASIDIFATEYEKLNLEQYNGSWANFEKFATVFLTLASKRGASKGAQLSLCRDYVYSVKDASEWVKTAVYSVVLQRLIYGNLLLNDKEFSSDIIAYMEAHSDVTADSDVDGLSRLIAVTLI